MRELDNDVSFLRNYLTEELCEELDLFVFELVDEEEFMDDKQMPVEQVDDELPHKSLGSLDEFGDADFDSDMVDAFEVCPVGVENPTLLTSYDTTPTKPVNPPPQPQPPEVTMSDHARNSEDDEFGMDDEDDFAADLEHVASLYDTRAVESPTDNQTSLVETEIRLPTADAGSAPIISLVDDDSDDFGEDIDADEFAAAEVAATQAPADPVRAILPHHDNDGLLNLKESTGY